MKNLLITGPSGNVGYELIRGLHEIGSPHRIIAAGHQSARTREALTGFLSLEFRTLDFGDPGTFKAALKDINTVFLMRPPQLADVHAYFEPFVDAMLEQEIKEVVFLSVQGVENQKRIPHYNIEKLILDKGLEYAFLRPAYFMQNLTTTLIHEIRTAGKIFIPAGKLKFTWVDARDIGLLGAHILNEFGKYRNQAYEITGLEEKNFEEVANLLSQVTGRQISYESPNLIKFFRAKRKLGIPRMMVFMMIMLHYLPRFSKKTHGITDVVGSITGRPPGTLKTFMEREKNSFRP
jgi:uncharacterized protein YbjT (DUF2867 family)